MSRFRDIQTSVAIKLALVANGHVGGLSIGVETINGIVVLSGFAQDGSHRDLAEEIARNHGGLDVRNDIEVLNEVEDSVTVPALLSDEGGDQIIRGHVQGDLESDGRIDAVMINVDAASGVVRLTGVQDSDGARVRAEQIARHVEGVRDVINDIRVRHAA